MELILPKISVSIPAFFVPSPLLILLQCKILELVLCLSSSSHDKLLHHLSLGFIIYKMTISTNKKTKYIISLLKHLITMLSRSTLKSYLIIKCLYDSTLISFHSSHSLSQRQHLNIHPLLGLVEVVASKTPITHIHEAYVTICSHYQALTLSWTECLFTHFFYPTYGSINIHTLKLGAIIQ